MDLCRMSDINETRMTIIKGLGGIPDFDKEWNEKDYDLEKSIATAIGKFGVPAIINVAVYYENNQIFVLPPFITISRGETRDVQTFLLKEFPRNSPQTSTTISNETDSLRNAIIGIYDNSIGAEMELGWMKYKKLNDTFPGVNIPKVIKLLSKDLDFNVTEDSTIGIFCVEYMKKLSELMESSEYSLRTYASYIVNHVLNMFELHDLTSYNKSENSQASRNKHSNICLRFVSESFHPIIDKLYADSIADTKNRTERILEMIYHLKTEFETLANNSDWLDSITLNGVKEKLTAMTEVVSYDNWILDDGKLNDKFKDLQIMNSSFLDNIRKIASYKTLVPLKKFQVQGYSERELNHLKLNATDVNAFYVQTINAIYFPLAIQNAPMYYEDLPSYLNFGALGYVIGHEITHGFDNEGLKYDKNGKLNNWWTNETKKRFDEKANCFVKQYGEFYDNRTKMNVNGTLTLAENIADNGGIRQSFKAYQRWLRNRKEPGLPDFDFTPEQLFFIAYGYSHCSHFEGKYMLKYMTRSEHTMPPYRVWGAISNSHDFARSFNCKLDSKMNPKHKCVLW